MMVIGGQFFNASTRLHDMVDQVEVLGSRGSCLVGSLPSPLYGLTAARLGNTVLACGGFHHYYRNLISCPSLNDLIPCPGVSATSSPLPAASGECRG